MANEISLVNLGKIAKPVDRLIEKIADAIGIVYEPTQIIRKAKAEAKANEIMAISGNKVLEIQQRAVNRFIHEETMKQENVENIIENAIPQILENANAEEIEKDWIVRFFEHAKLVSDEEMQVLWSKILAGESNNPGAFTKKTLNIVSVLEKKDAVLFSNLCKFTIGGLCPVIFDTDDEILKQHNITFMSLHHLENMGLIKFQSISGFQLKGQEKVISMNYFHVNLKVVMKNDSNNSLPLGKVMFTDEGRQLFRTCEAAYENEILDYIIQKYKAKEVDIEIL